MLFVCKVMLFFVYVQSHQYVVKILRKKVSFGSETGYWFVCDLFFCCSEAILLFYHKSVCQYRYVFTCIL